MNTVRTSSCDEYTEWYLKRDMCKGNRDSVPRRARKRRKIMKTPAAQGGHCGKWRDWYECADWSIIRITQDEFERLIPIENPWTEENLTSYERNGDDYRLLRNVVNAIISRSKEEGGFLECSEMAGYMKYYNPLKYGHMRIEGIHRIVLHSLVPNEKEHNPSGFFYLQDGWGRSFPHQILITEGHLSYEPVEAFLAYLPDSKLEAYG